MDNTKKAKKHFAEGILTKKMSITPEANENFKKLKELLYLATEQTEQLENTIHQIEKMEINIYFEID